VRLEKGAVAMIGFCFLVVFVTFMTIKIVQSRVMRKQLCEQRNAWEATGHEYVGIPFGSGDC
jgi:hypothetical protein